LLRKPGDLLARLGASTGMGEKAIATIALCTAPAVIFWLMLAGEAREEMDNVASERRGVSMLELVGEADRKSARFVRMGSLQSDAHLIEDTQSYLRAIDERADLGPAVEQAAGDAMRAFASIREAADTDARADATRSAMLTLDELSKQISRASGLLFDDSVAMRLPNEIRLEHAPAIGGRLELLRRRLSDHGSRGGDIRLALDGLEEAATDLARASSVDEGVPVAPELVTELARFEAALDALIARAQDVSQGRAARDIALTRALRDASASLETLKRAALSAIDQSLSQQESEIAQRNAAALGLNALLILLFAGLAFVFSRRAMIDPIHRLLHTTAALSTGEKEAEIDQQERQDEIGEIARFLAAANEFAKAKIAAEAARQSAEKANTDKSNFITMMTHELRTPLNAIIGYGELLLEDAQARGSDDADDLARLLGAARHLLQLISDVLDLSILEAGRLELSTGLVQPRQIVADVADRVRPLAEANRNTLHVVCAGDIAPFACDAKRLSQCLGNLASNAAKYTRDGKVEIKVEEYKRDGARALRFVVADTGTGIKTSQLKSLFDPFSQGADGLTRAHGGMGVGLALTRRLANAMGGDLSVQTAWGKGSTFTLWITDASSGAAENSQTRLAS
jgi:signal transduction histidine kinase